MEKMEKKEKLNLAEAIQKLDKPERDLAMSYIAGMLAGRKYAEQAAARAKTEAAAQNAPGM